MKRVSNPVIPDYRPKPVKEREPTLSFSPCVQCQKQIHEGFYARWGGGGTCSKTCELTFEGEERDRRFNQTATSTGRPTGH